MRCADGHEQKGASSRPRTAGVQWDERRAICLGVRASPLRSSGEVLPCDSAAGLTCVSGVCIHFAAPGGACEANDACPGGYACASGICAPNKAGSLCGGCGLGTGLYCAASNSTPPYPGTCQPRLDDGASCTRDVTLTGLLSYADRNPCAVGSNCIGVGVDGSGNAISNGICAPMSDVGGPCVQAASYYFITGCKHGLVCNAGRCTLPPADGQPCGIELECAPGASYCDPSTLTCQPTLPDGAPCACPHSSCTSGICAGANCVDARSPDEARGLCAASSCVEPP
jgi:hypothetical protein